MALAFFDYFLQSNEVHFAQSKETDHPIRIHLALVGTTTESYESLDSQ